MHPVAALLQPHFKYTMAADRVARANLFGAGGFIETTFSFGEYAMRMCSEAYDQHWQFDTEGLPGDLVNRYVVQQSFCWPSPRQIACLSAAKVWT